ncbi:MULTISPECIES: hypothetical protein [unclassified Rhizobium]|uniref:hypothetical protein n=1 Tax=unclassified Rhizobium TaxID=2613769 RepID=UPI0013C4F6CC|nr:MULTISPECIES: hypothetical protein [unclassified Rhizobium]
MKTILPCNIVQLPFIFARAKRQSPQRLAVVEARLPIGFRAWTPGLVDTEKSLDIGMRLLRVFLDWILRRRQTRLQPDVNQHSADDPWVLQQIEKFERELKR